MKLVNENIVNKNKFFFLTEFHPINIPDKAHLLKIQNKLRKGLRENSLL